MPDQTIDAYLDALKAALKGCDKALIQDALWDAEDHLRSELARRRYTEPGLDEAKALGGILAAYGEPAEIAAAYKERDAIVSAALAPLQPAKAPAPDGETEPAPAPHPSFFGVLKAPRAYSSLLYLLLSLATGIFFFTWSVTGLSLSMGLLVLIIGIPVLIAFLGSIRLLALAEGRLVEAMLGARMPRRQPPAEQDGGWKARLKSLFTDGRTWTSLGYLMLMLPLGIFYFTLMVTLLSLSLGLLATPVVHFVFHEVTYDGWAWGAAHQNSVAVAAGIVGLFAVPLTLHAALLLGRVQAGLARHLLVRI
ncbi:MAG TPA: sensor domain-containing protein [Holophagaceae bacterium]|nr:sensor domain-containing protein [Holophagaceae bacterium]